MSFSGLEQFNKNLLKLMKLESFKKCSESEKLNIGYKLINSKFGTGSNLKKQKIEIEREPSEYS